MKKIKEICKDERIRFLMEVSKNFSPLGIFGYPEIFVGSTLVIDGTFAAKIIFSTGESSVDPFSLSIDYDRVFFVVETDVNEFIKFVHSLGYPYSESYGKSFYGFFVTEACNITYPLKVDVIDANNLRSAFDGNPHLDNFRVSIHVSGGSNDVVLPSKFGRMYIESDGFWNLRGSEIGYVHFYKGCVAASLTDFKARNVWFNAFPQSLHFVNAYISVLEVEMLPFCYNADRFLNMKLDFDFLKMENSIVDKVILYDNVGKSMKVEDKNELIFKLKDFFEKHITDNIRVKGYI